MNELGLEANGESKIGNVSFYTDGDFTDLCRGPHAESTGKVGAFKLMLINLALRVMLRMSLAKLAAF